MYRPSTLASRLTPRVVPTVVAVCFIAVSLAAQTVQHLTITRPGGMPGLPVMTGLQQLTNGTYLSWAGPPGYYQVYQKSNSLLAPWLTVGRATNLMWNLTITKLYSNAFFRVAGPSPQYAGAQACVGCHDSIHNTEVLTPHAGAFTNAYFVAAGGQTNSSCLPCHTVGYGLPSGFVSQSKTPQLAGVQCENCHGPAANHVANPGDLSVVPRVDIAATVCGGCHTGPMQPTYEEWNSSGHAAVVPGALSSMTSSTNNISSCGRCHSGSVRLAMIAGKNPVSLTNDLNVALTCTVCHDPHATNANPVQLRNPLYSTNYFTLSTSAVFTNVYAANTNINLCGQCHNSRGAAWTDTSRAPHSSLQYNFLLGSIGQLFNGVTDSPALYNPATHAQLSQQCASCHLQDNAANLASHTFDVISDNVCLNCHSSDPGHSGPGISNQVTTVLVMLKNWAATHAPPALQTNGDVIWEYTSPGGLILQTNSLGYATGWILADTVNYSGPNSAGQTLIPDNIKKARFNLYLVVNDGTLGVHNFVFANNLLTSAKGMINQAMSP